MQDEIVLARASHRAQTQEPGVIAKITGYLRLSPRLGRLSGKSRDKQHRPPSPVRRHLGSSVQNRLVEARFTNGKLRRVNTDRQSSRAGVDVVAAERTLPMDVEPTALIQRKEMRRY